MAQIQNVKLSATKETGQGNNWDITVKYTAKFSDFEVKDGNFTFSDCFKLMEHDPGAANQKLTGRVACSVFNPNAKSVDRTLKQKIDANTLDTDKGPEELYAIVVLKNLGLDTVFTKESPILHLNP